MRGGRIPSKSQVEAKPGQLPARYLHYMYSKEKIRALFAQRRPGFGLPQALYVAPEVHDFDVEAIFQRTWLQAGLEAEIPNPGDYLTYAVGKDSILLLRDPAGKVVAFFNTCRHRGARICGEKPGHAVRLVCPYHQWSYDLNGQLLQAPRMHAGFQVSGYRLKPVRVETVAGVIFVCLSDTPPDFAPLREKLAPMLEPHDLRNAKVVHTATLIEQANWKLVMENARECYHCRVSHPQLMRSYRDFTVKEDSDGPPSWEIEFQKRCEARGLKYGEFIGPWWQVGRYALGDGVFSYTMDGRPAVKRTLGSVGDGDVGTMWWGVNPNCFNHVTGDYGFFFQAMPSGPQETIVTGKWIVHRDAVEGVDYNLERLTEVWNATNDQDRALAQNNQRGVNSSAFAPGPYSQLTEELVLRLIDWYCATAEEFLARG
jgi:glycine betaine catabolism A